MRDAVSPALDERDQELCARAAWLYHGAGLTQGEVARRLGVPSVKAHRLIARANRLGFIHVSIDAPVAACVQLENELQNNGWLHCSADRDLIFGDDIQSKYDRAMEKIGIRPGMLSSDVGHA